MLAFYHLWRLPKTTNQKPTPLGCLLSSPLAEGTLNSSYLRSFCSNANEILPIRMPCHPSSGYSLNCNCCPPSSNLRFLLSTGLTTRFFHRLYCQPPSWLNQKVSHYCENLLHLHQLFFLKKACIPLPVLPEEAKTEYFYENIQRSSTATSLNFGL